MCLNRLNFALEYDKTTKEYIGYGYKLLPNFKTELLGEWQEAIGWASETHTAKSFIQNGIQLANSEKSSESNYADYKMSLVDDNDKYHDMFQLLDKQYHAGFHIFLNKEDAKDYGYTHNLENVYLVQFKNVLAFGTNEIPYRNINFAKKHYGPCVVSQYMKVIGHHGQ